MKSLSFPKMFNNIRTYVNKDHEATLTNLKLLLLTEKGTLFGDPYFGTNLQQKIFEQGTPIIADLIIDDVLTAIQDYMPQLVTNRNNITVRLEKEDVYVTIKALNLIDFTPDLYDIKLTNS